MQQRASEEQRKRASSRRVKEEENDENQWTAAQCENERKKIRLEAKAVKRTAYTKVEQEEQGEKKKGKKI